MVQISLRADDDVKRGAKQALDDTFADPFYSESNLAHLRCAHYHWDGSQSEYIKWL